MFKINNYEVDKELEDFYNDDKLNNANIKLLLSFPKIDLNLEPLNPLDIKEPEAKKVDKIIITRKKNKKDLF